MAQYPITGVPSSFRVPGQYGEILPAQGPATASAGKRAVMFCMVMLAAGASWTAGTVYRVKNEQTAITGGGEGSPAHRGLRKALMHNKNAVYYALPYAPTTGGTPIAADGTVIITGTATDTGVVKVTLQGVECSATYKKDDTPTVIGDALAASINAKTWLACTAANATGTVTITARVAGESQGDGTTGIIRYRSEATAGSGVSVADSGAALGLGTGTTGAEGTTTEIAQATLALANIESSRYYYIGTNLDTTAGLTIFKTHVANKSEPRPGLRSVCVGGWTGILSTCQTTAIAQNFERMQIVWQKNSEHDLAELVGNVLAIRQKKEELDAGFNFDDYAEADWGILPAYANADWPDDDDKNDAINDGITVIASNQTTSYMVMSTVTRSKNSTGTIDDFRATESHRTSIADELFDELLIAHAITYKGQKLGNDAKLADGSVNPIQKPAVNTVIASAYKPWFFDKIEAYSNRTGNLQEVNTTTYESLDVVRDPQNTGRLECSFDFRTADMFHQVTFRGAEVTPG